MDAATFKEYLQHRYYDQLHYYESAAGRNQKKYKNIQWVLIILSTLTTIMAALPKEFDLQYAIVITAAIVTILTSGLKTFQYQELWVSYRSTIEQLKPELYLYQFNINEYGKPGIDKESLFVSRVESILSKEHDVWPANKKIKDQDTQNDELQKRLEELLKDKIIMQKIITPALTDPAQQNGVEIKKPDTADVGDPNIITTEQSDTAMETANEQNQTTSTSEDPQAAKNVTTEDVAQNETKDAVADKP